MFKTVNLDIISTLLVKIILGRETQTVNEEKIFAAAATTEKKLLL